MFGYEFCAAVSYKVVNTAGLVHSLAGGLEDGDGGISLSHRHFSVPPAGSRDSVKDRVS